MLINPLNNIRARADIDVGPVDDIEMLHAAAIKLGLGQLEGTGQCGTFWIMSVKDAPAMVLETRWANELEKRMVIAAVSVTDPTFKRSDLPADLSEAPDHLDALFAFSFERTGATRATIWRWPPGHPEQRTDAPPFEGAEASFTGRLWNLFAPPLAH